jgi:transposase
MFVFFGEKPTSGLASHRRILILESMDDRATLSKTQLLQLLQESDVALQTQAAEIQTQVVELRRADIQRQEREQKFEKLTQDYESLQLAYNKLLQQRFGNHSERYIDNPDQLRLDFGDTDEAADAAAGLDEAIEEADLIPAHRRRKPRKKRDESLPEHLPRYEVTAEVFDDVKSCPTHGLRTLLPESMWDTTETLEFGRPQLAVRVTKYPKYVCSDQPECGIASPERPTGIVEGDKYGASIAAEIITGKYGYHLPIYRQQDYFAGSGWTPGRSTLLNILTNSHFVIEPLLAFFKTTVQGDSVVGCDDTSVTLLYSKTIPTFDLKDPKERRIHEVFSKALDENKPSIQAKMWAYRGAAIPLNVFDFTVSRHRDGPELFFADYQGTLLGDCWSGFRSIAADSDGLIRRAACSSHARRKIRESLDTYPQDAVQMMDWFKALYEIEGRGKLMSQEERLALRHDEAKPIWESMETWLEEVKLRTSNVILPKSDFGKALQYIRNHFDELTLYLNDALVPNDNNETEQLMKQVAIGRKNWLFSGSIAGGERSAGFLTLVSSALRNDLDAWLYIKDVLDQLLAGVTDYAPLLPWNWKSQHPEAIRVYRVEERQQRTERKQSKRAARRRKQKQRRR